MYTRRETEGGKIEDERGGRTEKRKTRVDTGHASCQFNSAWMHDDDNGKKKKRRDTNVREWREK